MEPVHLTLIMMGITYLLPTIIAYCRDYHNRFPIFLLNVLLGWTGLGWVIALIWSCCSKQRLLAAV